MSDLVWQKSSFVGSDAGQEYIEIAVSPDGQLIHLRESQRPETVVTTTLVKWEAFVKGVQAGEFDSFADL